MTYSQEEMPPDKHFICLLTSGRIFELVYGGEERFTSLLCEWLLRRGIGVILMAATFASIKSKQMSLEGIQKNKETMLQEKRKIRVLKPPYMIYLGSRFVLSLLWIIKIILTNFSCPIFLLHSQDTGYSGLAAIIAGRLLRIPVVLTSHGIRHKTLESTIQGKFRKLILKVEYSLDMFNVKNADLVLAVSPSIKEYLQNESSRNIEFLPICIKTNEYKYSAHNREEIRRELGIREDMVVVGFVGRFSDEKNIDALLASFANALQNNKQLMLLLVGTGPGEVKARDFIKSRLIEENVIFCGVRYDINRILSGIDIFVLPSIVEGLSTSLLEAMACRRAVICSDIDANRSVITHRKNGLLVRPQDIEEIQHAIELLSQDKQLRSELGMLAETTALSYDEEIVLPKILEIYQSLTRSK